MSRIFRVGGVILVSVVILAAIITSLRAKPANADIVWDAATVAGRMDAKNYFIIYSDVACPYCIAFENAIVENKAEFERYIEENDILVEVRVSDFLYEYGESRSRASRYGAEAIYCAKNEGRFWDYYDLVVSKIWNDFYKKSGKGAFGEFNKLGKEYWIQLGESIELGEEFAQCLENDETLDEIKENTKKTAELANGMPFFKFNSYATGGFDLSWGWEHVLMYFEAGLQAK